ncbi:acetyl-CoA carboxylase carboxyltransferase subunit beta [Globicatella sulfidifaciens]
MKLFKNKKIIRLNAEPPNYHEKKSKIPDNFLTTCPHCKRNLLPSQVTADYTCERCQRNLQFPANARINWLLDEGSFEELATDFSNQNPIDFPDYEQKIAKYQQITNLKEAVVVGTGLMEGMKVALGVMDNRFMMASMGTAVGEKITQLFERATQNQLPVILFIASGGARMQEGIMSLMQMGKISQAVNRHHQAGLLYLAVLTHPTTGGVTASFAMQADIILAEEMATIGFAGKRVIEQTIKAKLPKEFQTAETVLENGFIDSIVKRTEQKNRIKFLLRTNQRVMPL